MSTYNEPGRGRKLCSCGVYVGVRNAACEKCGTVFDLTPKTVKAVPVEKKVTPVVSATVTVAPVIRTPKSKEGAVTTPAGKCPFELTSTDLSTVKVWAERVTESYEKRGHTLALEGLIYYVRHFFQHGSEKYKEVIAILKPLLQN